MGEREMERGQSGQRGDVNPRARRHLQSVVRSHASATSVNCCREEMVIERRVARSGVGPARSPLLGSLFHGQSSRMVLLMLAMVVAILSSTSNSGGQARWRVAAQIGPPNLSICGQTSDCCMIAPAIAPTAFAVNNSIPLHTRPALQSALQTTTYVTQINAAYTRLRSLPSTDPRSLEQQRRTHCAFCAFPPAYGNAFQVHSNWYFLPWHRMFLYYHERILAWANGNSAFALGFWNWDSSSGRAFPSAFTVTTSSLYTPNRDTPTNIANNVLLATTTEILRTNVRDAGQSTFFGTSTNGNPGSLEWTSHNGVHVAVGRQSDGREMGRLEWASLDPIFYAHHANVDRLWTVWLGLPGTRSNPSSTSWRNSRYTFYDENARARTISVSDVLSTSGNLRYSYQAVTNSWAAARRRMSRRLLQTAPPSPPPSPPLPTGSTSLSTTSGPLMIPSASDRVSVALSSPITVAVPGDRVRPLLKIQQLRFDGSTPLVLHVFINQPDATVDTPRSGNPNYVTSLFSILGGPSSISVNLNLPITDALARGRVAVTSPISVQVVQDTSQGQARQISFEAIQYSSETGQ